MLQGQILADFKCVFGHLNCNRSIHQYFGRQFLGGRHELLIGGYPIDQTDLKGFPGIDDIAGQQQLGGTSLSNQARQSLGAAGAGDDAEFNLRQPHNGRLSRNSQGTGKGEFQAAA